MPLDLSGFDSGVETFPQLYKIGDDIRQNRQLDATIAARNQTIADKNTAQRNAQSNYFDSYLDPKKYLTGTNEDPYIINRLATLNDRAKQMISQGVDSPSVSMAINSDVAKLTTASTNLKALNAAKKDYLAQYSKVSGIDPTAFGNAFDKSAYYTTDENGKPALKDLSDIDPTQAPAIADNVLRNGDVFNAGGFDKMFEDANKANARNSYSGTTEYVDSKKKTQKSKVLLNSENYLVSEKDAKGNHIDFVPKYEIANDGNDPIYNDFKTEKGDNSSQPVRLLSDDVFNTLPPSTLGYLRQEVRKYASDNNTPLNSVQAENLAKAFAYDELNAPTRKSGRVTLDNTTKEAPAPRISVSVNNNKDIPTIDVYNSLRDKIEKNKENYIQTNATTPSNGIIKVKGAVPFNSLDDTEQSVIMEKLKNAYGDKYTGQDIYISEPPDIKGGIEVYDNNTNNPLFSVSKKGAALSANKSLGIKSKQKAVENNVINTGKTQPNKKNNKQNNSKDPLGIL